MPLRAGETSGSKRMGSDMFVPLTRCVNVPTNQTSRFYRRTDGQNPIQRGRALLHLIFGPNSRLQTGSPARSGACVVASNLPSVDEEHLLLQRPLLSAMTATKSQMVQLIRTETYLATFPGTQAMSTLASFRVWLHGLLVPRSPSS